MNRQAIVSLALSRWFAGPWRTPQSRRLARRLSWVVARVLVPMPRGTFRALYADAGLPQPHRAWGAL